MLSAFRHLCLWLCFLPINILAQNSAGDTISGYVLGYDTLIVRELPEVRVMPKPRTQFKNKREMRYYARLVQDIKATLPYAKIASGLLTELNHALSQIENEKEQKEYLKLKEKELFAEFEPIIRKMNVRRGRLLLKLIDRECQITSYEVVKIYRGGFSAFFWQGVARIFGNNLKSIYNPYGEDAMIEEIISLIELGVI